MKVVGAIGVGLAAAAALSTAALAEPDPAPTPAQIEPQPTLTGAGDQNAVVGGQGDGRNPVVEGQSAGYLDTDAADQDTAGRTGGVDEHSAEVDNQHPTAGTTVVVTGHGFEPSEPVSFDAIIDMSPESQAGTHLTTARAATNGDGSATVKVPTGFSGRLPIKLTGQTSGVTKTVTVDVTVPRREAATAANLPVTGPGALGYTAAGLILLVGGASLITIAHLRRTAHVAAHASR
ncbi:hypothetical protein [Dactylosporangium matsuzakiense]|uniref:hypothetical protein n=1 Tax=Dactylosporangium matsuzakiense TaxID=53360 RepID=UPI0021C27726|nr:hypothetical protein [Dactylosporangium matsuzakiense]UWZ43627.1 hypothetical protein Dmats_40290 [Dactylosporangium matsuzakiense]